MIVESHPGAARDLELRLMRLGFAVAGVAATSEQAVAIADRERPALTLLDLHLPGAIAAADHLRDQLALPVVFLTAHADDAMLRAAGAAGPGDHVVDASDERELRAVLELALYKHAAERERQSLERQLRRAEKMDAIGQLAGGIAHDFNNVLMTILSSCRALLAELPAGHRPHHQVALIRGAAQRAAGMTRQLLAFGRDDHGAPVALDLAAHIHRTSAMLVQLLADNISVVIALAPGLRAVLGRSSEIEQVIMNLVVNARDAMPRGGTITIAARNVVETDEVVLTVTDTGEGIDEATRRRMFEPFFTTKELGAGTGLGLATVYAVVVRSHGRIAVASEPGKGTTFSIWLPATPEIPVEPADGFDDLAVPVRAAFEASGALARPAAGLSADQADPADQAVGPDGAPITALHGTVVVVEDDEQVREAICDILKEAGLDVIEAGDGLEALHACRSCARPVDLVLSDVVMPRLGGAELARSLAVAAPATKILYMSGYPSRSDGVLQKPFTPGQLLSWIRDALAVPAPAI
ncbi:MAG TPA: response regulator [Kofleriaceae bacterium]|nr:response regulator [Kofleriaceae bacterium]